MSEFLRKVKELTARQTAYGVCVEFSYNNQLQEWESRVRPMHMPETWAAASGPDVERVLADTLKQLKTRVKKNDMCEN